MPCELGQSGHEAEEGIATAADGLGDGRETGGWGHLIFRVN